jgi:feruloyl esterase
MTSVPGIRRALAVLVLAASTACTTSGGETASLPPVDYRLADSLPAKACADLQGFQSAGATILHAVEKPATEAVPEHCEVRAVIAPQVNIRVQLPEAWNGRFYMAGNGGLAGEPVDERGGPAGDPTAVALSRGFATAVTDTGHDRRVAPDASFADDPQLLIDYAYRAVHETAALGKALALDYYAAPGIRASYWEGCSTGGRQALMSAQRFPEDFDGVIAGAPISDYTGTLMTTFWTTDRAERAELSDAQLQMIAGAYDAACDDYDGLADGVVANFEGCAFEPDDLPVCEGNTPSDDCVTAEQIELLNEIVVGPMANGEHLHAGLPIATMKALPGQRSPWFGWWVPATEGQTPLNLAIHGSSMEHMVFQPPRPGYDWRSFDFATDPALLGDLSALIDATDPNLDALRDRGGKVLMYHGTADPALVIGMSIDYRNAVVDRYGEEASRDFYRLYALPGMHHCRGGYGPDTVDYLDAIVQWVEAGRAPDGLVARQVAEGQTLRSRPFCEYPTYAEYEGGDPNDAASFSCKLP